MGGTRREQELGEVKERGFRVSREPACDSRVVLSRKRDNPAEAQVVKEKHCAVTWTRPLGTEGCWGRLQGEALVVTRVQVVVRRKLHTVTVGSG